MGMFKLELNTESKGHSILSVLLQIDGKVN